MKIRILALISGLFLLVAGCDKIVLPRLLDDRPVAQIPISVTLAFDQPFLDSIMSVDACGEAHQIQLGNVLSETFLEVSGQSFATVTAQRGEATPTPVAGPPPLTIHLSLVHQSFVAPTRFAEEDTYKADLSLQVLAVYVDPAGNTLAQRPLTYKERVSIWTPQDTSTPSTCATHQLEGAVVNAGDDLARDMLSIIPGLLGQPPPQTNVAQAPIFPAQPRAAAPMPTLSFRTLLKDGNDNLVLEGGENLVLQIEVTNESNVPISTAQVELTGTPAIVQAFTQVTPLPIQIGSFQPGEKKTTEVRGRMPFVGSTQKGELIVSVKPKEGSPASSHKILAAIGPGSASDQQTVAQSNNPSKSSVTNKKQQTRNVDESRYYAIIVGLDQYRDPWPQAHQIPRRHLAGLIDTLRTTGNFPKSHIRVLHGKHATRADIEESLFSWARDRLKKDSILLFYFAGHTVADPIKGEVFLVPYEGSLQASKKRLISLRSLQRVLSKLDNQLSILFLDTPVIQYLGKGHSVGQNGNFPPNWNGAIVKTATQRHRVIQVRRILGEKSQDPAKLLSGLLGRADRNQDGKITVGEFLVDVQNIAEVIPHSPQNLPEANILLAE